MMLVPRRKGQPVTSDVMDRYTPAEGKLELFDGDILPFYHEKEKLILICLYNLGLEKFVQILPDQSKVILKQILDGENNHHIPIYFNEQSNKDD